MVITLLFSSNVFGQLTGIKTIPGNYATLASAITSLNLQGVGTGGVIFNVAAGYVETAPAGGLVITATGTATNTIVFQKSGTGANPLITAPILTAATAYDGVVKIAGGDYITIDGINIVENSANSVYLTDWGYALVKASDITPFNGCQYVTIKNCTISLNKSNQTAVGIYAGNHIATATIPLTITATTDAMNNCKFFNNTISNVYCGISITGFAAVTPFTLYDSNNEIGVGGANSITNLGGGATSVRAINASGQKSLIIANNIINSSINGLTSTGYGIYTSGGTSSNVDIYNNTITLTLTAGVFSSAINGISNGMGSTAASNTVNIYNNTITNCNISAATTANFNGIVNTATAATVNMYGNTVNGCTLAGIGDFSGIYNIVGMGTGPLTIYSNIITNNTKSGASGNLFCIQASTATINFYSNNIHDNSATGTTSLYGYYNAGSPVIEIYRDNTIYNLSHTGTGTVSGLQINTVSGTKNIYGNNIYNLSSGGNVIGYSSWSGMPTNFYKNKIYNISTTGAASQAMGISYTGTTGNIYNNFISDIKAPSSTNVLAVVGINITGGTTQNLFYNTIYLNATSSSASTFGSAGIYKSSSITGDFRNNIIVNNSTAGSGAGSYTAAVKLSGTYNAQFYSNSSNNNCLYAGTPSATNLIFSDGTNNIQTLAAYQTLVTPRDLASFTENPPFENVATTPYNLHVKTTVATGCESGGIQITNPISITDDFDSDTRTTTPDVGADEFIGNTSSVLNPTFSAAAISSSQINLTFTANPSSNNVVIVWNTTGVFSNPSGIPPTTIGNAFAGGSFLYNGLVSPVSHTGLTAGTTYYYKAFSYDGSFYSSGATANATTPCAPVSVFPYSEGFETGFVNQTTIAGCYTQQMVTGNAYWTANSTLTDYNRGARTGTRNAYLRYATDTWLCRQFHLIGGQSYTYSFYARQDATTGSNIEVKYGSIGNSAGMTNTIISSTAVTNGAYQLKIGTFTPTATGDYFIGIHGVESTGSMYLSIDDISLYLTPSCPTPTTPIATLITSTSASLRWNLGGTESAWIVFYKTVAAPTYTAINNVTANPYLLTGLTPNTSYMYYVRAKCAVNDTSAVSTTTTFTTTCNTISAFPYIEDFETNALPTCWTETRTPTSTFGWASTTTGYVGRGMRFNSLNNTNGNMSLLKTPVINISSLSSAQLEFWWKNPNGGNYRLLLSTDGGNTFPVVLASNMTAQTAWVLKTINLSSYITTGSNLVIGFEGTSSNSNGDAYLYLDKLVIDVVPTCPEPTALTSNSYSPTTASLGWTAGGTETAWIVYYKTVAAANYTVINNVTSNPYTLSGLVAASNYIFMVKANCAVNDTSVVSATKTFTTACNANIVFPYLQDFEVNSLPTCWTELRTPTSTTGWASYATGYVARGVRFDSFNNANGNISILKTPILNLTSLSSAQMEFWWKNPTGGNFRILLSNDGGATFPIVLATNLTAQTNWVLKTINLSSYISTGSNVVIGFEGTSNWANGDAYIYLDKLKIDLVPTCPIPTALTATSITTTSANLGWTPGGTETAWIVYYKTVAAPNYTIINNVTTNSYSLSGLTVGTNYMFMVKANCALNDTSYSSAPKTFATVCNATTLLPWTEGFESVTTPALPSCWLKQNGDYISATNMTSNQDANARTGARFMIEAGTATNEYIWTPGFQLTAGTSYDFSFWWAGDTRYGWTGDVFYNTFQDSTGATQLGNSFVTSGTTTSLTYQQALRTFIPTTTGTYYFAIRVNATNYPFYLSFDDFRLANSPSCPPPTSLTTVNTTSNSATLSWTPGGTETAWILYYKKATDLAYTVVNNVNSNTYLLSGLTVSTNYLYYVKANCAVNDTSVVSAIGNFTTNCSSITTFPFIESFDGTTFAPPCWSNIETDGSGTANVWTGAITGANPTCAPHSGAGMAMFNTFTYPAGIKAELTTPALNLPSDLYQVSFWMYRDDGYVTYVDSVNIYFNTAPNSIGGILLGTVYRHNTLAPVQPIANQWYQYTFNLPAGSAGNNKYVVLEGVCGYGNNVFVDDVQINVQPTCPAPTALTATAINTTSATLGWTAGGTESSWKIYYKEATATNYIIINNVTSNSYLLSGLTPGTNYIFNVIANCTVSDTSLLSLTKPFTTTCAVISSFPYTEEFEGLTIPGCWSEARTPASTFGWETTTLGFQGKGLRFDCVNNQNGNISNLKTPVINLTSLTTAQLSFWWKNPTGGNFTVLLSTNGGVSFPITLADTLTAQTGWTLKTINLSSYIASGNNVMIEFRGTSNFGAGDSYIYLDKLKIGEISTCLDPINISASNITTTTADLDWASSAPSFALRYRVVGSANWINTTTTTVNPSLSGLLPSSNYEVQVMAFCSTTDSSSWSYGYFTTLCDLFTVPFAQNFNVLPFTPNCWSLSMDTLNSNINLIGNNSSWVSDNFLNVSSGQLSATLNIWGANMVSWLITPQINLGTTANKLEFDLAATSWNTANEPSGTRTDDKFAVIISTDGGNTWAQANTLRLWDNAGSANVYNDINMTSQHIEIDLTAYTGIVKIAFYGESLIDGNGDNDLFVDNVTVNPISTICNSPVALASSGINETSARLYWTAGGTETSWNLRYKKVVDPTYIDIPNITAQPYTLTGLTAGIAYVWNIQAICSSSLTSPWSIDNNFTLTGITNNSLLGLNVYSYNNQINVINNDHIFIQEVAVYDVLGKIVAKYDINSSDNILINTNYSIGNYIIKVVTKDKVGTYKLFIK